MEIKKLIKKNLLDIKLYIPSKPITEIERELKIKDIIQNSSNENPNSPSKKVINALKNELKNINRYPDGGAFYLKKDLAKKLSVKPENIILGNGGDEVLSMICETFLYPNDEAIIGSPTFGAYEIFIKTVGGKPIYIELDNFKFNLDKILKEITKKTKIIFICNPNNPTGTIVLQKEVESFLKKVPENIIVVFDEAYMEYVENKKFPNTINFIKKGYKNILSLRTFSKIYSMAGLRVGYGIADEEFINCLNIVRKPYNVNCLAQTAARASLQDKNIVLNALKINKTGKEFLYKQFDKINVKYIPTESNFIFVNTGMDSKKAYDELLKKGILVRNGSAFGYPEYVRLTIGTEKENIKFIKIFKEILREIRKV